jgi:hypothetical protein
MSRWKSQGVHLFPGKQYFESRLYISHSLLQKAEGKISKLSKSQKQKPLDEVANLTSHSSATIHSTALALLVLAAGILLNTLGCSLQLLRTIRCRLALTWLTLSPPR